MPYVNIKIAKGEAPVTKEQKNQLIKGVTQLLHEALNKSPQSTYVVIEEIDPDNWGVGGESLAVARQKSD